MSATIHSSQVSSIFDMTDQTVYRWRFWNVNRSVGKAIFLLLVLAVLIPAIPFIFLHLVSLFSMMLAIGLAWFFIAVAIIGTIVTIAQKLNGSKEDRLKGSAGLFSIATMGIGVVHFLLTYSEGEYIQEGFKRYESGELVPLGEVGGWGWLVFMIDNVFSVILLDIPEVYGFHVSDIRPEGNFACAITVGIRIMVTIGLIEMILSVYRSELMEQEFFGTNRECVHYCDNFIGANDLLMERTGHVAPEPTKLVVDVKSFLNTLKPQL